MFDFVNCLGPGLPFESTALGAEWMAGTSRWLRQHQKPIGRIVGVMRLLIGNAEVADTWHNFVRWLQAAFLRRRASDTQQVQYSRVLHNTGSADVTDAKIRPVAQRLMPYGFAPV